MNTLEILIESEKAAYLQIRNSLNDFGVFSKSKYDYSIGFQDNPLFEINHSLVQERWYIDALPNGRHIPHLDIRFDETAHAWLKDSCCTDFSVFNNLPDGQYRLIKTDRKIIPTDKILYGNEWEDSPGNVMIFEGFKDIDFQKYYPLIVGNDVGRAPAISQPLLCVVLADYGIVWEGATGFVFLSFAYDEFTATQEKKTLLLIPYSASFTIDCMNDEKQFDKNTVDAFINKFL